MIKQTAKLIGGFAIAIAGGTLATILSPSINQTAKDTVFDITDRFIGHDVVVKKGFGKKRMNTKALRKQKKEEEKRAKAKSEKKNTSIMKGRAK